MPTPPPMPGLIDRYSPMPAASRSQSATGNKPRPVYLDATPVAAPRDTPIPRGKRVAPAAPVDDDELDERPSRMPLVLAVAGVLGLGGLVLVAVAAVVAINVFGGGDDAPEEQAAAASRPAPQVQVRNNMTQKPGLIGVEAEGTAAPSAPVAASGAPAPAPAPGPAPSPAGTEARSPVAAPIPAPAPVAPRRPAPAATQVATKGVLKIRSNRRVLVYVDGQAAGYTPLEVKVEPGDHEIVAMVPGQANTKQEREASVRSGGETVAVDFAF